MKGEQIAGPRDAALDGRHGGHVHDRGRVVEVARRYLRVERTERLGRHDQRALEHVADAALELLVDQRAERKVVHKNESTLNQPNKHIITVSSQGRKRQDERETMTHLALLSMSWT